MQIIFHIDLNAFFVSAEITLNPHLKNKPVVVCKSSKRSIITTASYEARKYGIHSAMPLFQAQKLCRDLIIIPPHIELYKSLSQQFFELISTFSDELEIASIDECYVDMTEYIQSCQLNPYIVAKDIQKVVYNTLKLNCSIGIAPNKFLAKMASDMKKPKGITMITHSNYKEMLWHLPIESMFGIGKKTAPKLIDIGIKTIGDLAQYKNYEKIKPILGKNALLYYQKANGKDFSKISKSKNILKSINNSITFEDDTNDEIFIKNTLKQLAFNVSQRAKKSSLVSNSVSITIKYTHQQSKSKQMIIDHYTNDPHDIYLSALILFESLYNDEIVRLVGVTLNNVIDFRSVQNQMNLFNYNLENDTNQSTQSLINELNNQLQNAQLIKASDLISNK